MNPTELKYTIEHEWIGQQGGLCVVGITEFAQDQLGDITYVELPEVGRIVARHAETAVVESVKAASDIYAPVGGTVAEVNEALLSAPELVNQDPYGRGWFFKLENIEAAQLADLMDYVAYQTFAAEEAH